MYNTEILDAKSSPSPAAAKRCMIVVVTVAELYIAVEKENLPKRDFTKAKDNGQRSSQKRKPDEG